MGGGGARARTFLQNLAEFMPFAGVDQFMMKHPEQLFYGCMAIVPCYTIFFGYALGPIVKRNVS